MTLDTNEIVRRMRYCDKRWWKAMWHPDYRDEDTEQKPFSEAERLRYWWADAWRTLYHEYETALYKQHDVRLGMIEGLNTREHIDLDF